MYAFRALPPQTSHYGDVIEIPKAKGMTKYDKNGRPLFTWDDYEAMHHPTDPKPLVCSQTQFKLGMSGYCRDGDGVQPITIHKIPKKASAKKRGAGERGGGG